MIDIKIQLFTGYPISSKYQYEVTNQKTISFD